jgi:hypothetical protein
LNCLYHLNDPKAAALAERILAKENDAELKARAQKVIDHAKMIRDARHKQTRVHYSGTGGRG